MVEDVCLMMFNGDELAMMIGALENEIDIVNSMIPKVKMPDNKLLLEGKAAQYRMIKEKLQLRYEMLIMR